MRANFPLSRTALNPLQEILDYPMQDMEATDLINQLAYRVTQISIAFTALHLASIQKRFHFPLVNIWSIEKILGQRKNILSKEELKQDPEAFTGQLVASNSPTEFEIELGRIRQVLWQVFGIANDRRAAADSRLPVLFEELRARLPKVQSPMDLFEGETGYLLRDTRHLAGEVFKEKLESAFAASHPELGKMLFEDIPEPKPILNLPTPPLKITSG